MIGMTKQPIVRYLEEIKAQLEEIKAQLAVIGDQNKPLDVGAAAAYLRVSTSTETPDRGDLMTASEQNTVFPADLEYVNLKHILEFLAARYQVYVAPRTWHRWAAQRVGPPRLRMGRSIVYRVADLTEWVDSHLEHVRQPARGPRG
jgi:hypothetical protein